MVIPVFNIVNSSCLSTYYPTLSLPCFKIGECLFDSLVAYKSNMLNETSTEFWLNFTDTQACFSRTSNAGLITISADLSYDSGTEACLQKHGSIQLGVS